MKTNNTFNNNGYEVKLHYVMDCSDEYYFDETYYLTINDVPYIFCYIDSLSGYIPMTFGLIQESFDYFDDRKSTNVSITELITNDFYRKRLTMMFVLMTKNKAKEVSFTESLDGSYWYIRK
ncbi:MAG: hypothetical protein HFF01_09750 [Erysipelotrichaceae bacterium]|nr:hypothetical protein [Erysipelotrichaceae bacterium]MCI9525288.1 hypothetical protein [Erysipelotrichaceae bacterium]